MPDDTPPRRTSSSRPSNIRRFLVPLLAVVVLGAILSVPGVARVRAWRAANIVRQGQELARQQLWTEAAERFNAALKIAPSNPECLRSLAEVYSRFELPSALPLYRGLLQVPGHTPADLHSYLNVALKLSRFDIVESELAKLLSGTNVSIPTRIQAVEYYFRQGDLGRALAFANEIRRLEPTNVLHHLRAAKVLMYRGIPSEQVDAINIFRDVKAPTPLERLNMLEILSNAPSIPKKQALQFLDTSRPTGQVSITEYFFEAAARLRAAPESRSNLVNDAVQHFKTGSPEEQSALCNWLVRIGVAERATQLWRPDDVVKVPGLVPVYLDALNRTGRWADIQTLVARDLPLEPWQTEAYKATAAARLKQDQSAAEHWRRAMEQTGRNPAKLRALGDFAAAGGFFEQAVAAHEGTTKDRLFRAGAFRRLNDILRAARQTERLRLNAQAWAASVPDDPQPELDFCYLSALIGKDVEPTYIRAKKLFDRQPSRISYRTTLAYLQLRKNDPVAALNLLDRIRFDNPQIPAQTRLVYAVILEANGQPARAKEMVEGLKPEQLLPEEAENLRRVRGL